MVHHDDAAAACCGQVGRVGVDEGLVVGHREGAGQRKRLGGAHTPRDLAQRITELRRIRPLRRIRATGPLEHLGQGPQLVTDGQVGVDPGPQGAQCGVGGERHVPGDRLDQDERQRIDVALARGRLAIGLLWRGIARGPEHRTRRLGPRRLGQGARHPEVGDAQASVLEAEQEVGGLDVAVDEALAMGEIESAGGTEADLHRLGHGEAPTEVEHRAETATVHVLGDEVGPAVITRVEELDDVRVVELRSGLGLGTEAPQEGLVVRQGGVQHLDRDEAREADVVGEEDLSRRTGADGRFEPVARTQDPTDLVGHLGQQHIVDRTGWVFPSRGPTMDRWTPCDASC